MYLCTEADVKSVFVTMYPQENSADPAWAGYNSVGRFLAAQLRSEGIELVPVGGFREDGKLWRGARQAAHNLVASRRYLRFVEPSILRGYARQLAQQLEGKQVDCIVSHGWLPVAFLETDIPIVVHNDAPLGRMIDYYEYYSNLTEVTARQIRAMEQQALERAAYAVYASDWAADGVRAMYPSCAHKVAVVPYGPALESSLIPQNIPEILARRSAERCELLFLGVDWERKGGPLALEVVRRLSQSGMSCRLTIVGCRPSLSVDEAALVEQHDFVDPRTEPGRQLFLSLLYRSHIALLPVRAEAFGLVFAEASAFGIPSFTVATGGVPTAVRDGVNGKLFAPDAEPEEYCAAIRSLMSKPDSYRSLVLSSRREYEQRLNWENAGNMFAAILRRVAG